jgi:hypothetical protein
VIALAVLRPWDSRHAKRGEHRKHGEAGISEKVSG